MSRVFISYARENREFVLRLSAALEQRGKEAWVDEEGIESGDRWRLALEEAIDGADAVLFVLSPDWTASRPCGDELAYAAAANKRLVALVIADAPRDKVYEVLGDVPAALAEIDWIFAGPGDDFEAAVDEVVAATERDLDLVRLHTRVLTRARAWETSGRRVSPLLRGEELRDAELWRDRATSGAKPAPTELQSDFITASRRASSRRQRTIAAVASVVAVISIALAVFALIQRGTAQREARVALSRALALESEAALGQGSGGLIAAQPERGVLLSLEAYRISPTQEARGAVLDALEYTARVEGFLDTGAGTLNDVAYSPDGSVLAVDTTTGGVQLWNARTRRIIGGLRLPASLHMTFVPGAVAFSPDGREVVAETLTSCVNPIGGDCRKALVIFEVASRRLAAAPLVLTQDLGPMAFISHDDLLVADGSILRLIALAQRHELAQANISCSNFISAVNVAGDDSVAAVGCDNGTAEVFDLRGALRAIGSIPALSGGTGTRLALNPSGTMLAASEGDGDIQLWDLTGGTPQRLGVPFGVGDGTVESVAFAPDGLTLAAAYSDGEGRLWELNGRWLWGFLASSESLQSLTFSPNGQTLAAADSGGRVTLWNVVNAGYSLPLQTVLRSYRADKYDQAVAFSPTGAMLATAGTGDVVTLWNASDGRPAGPVLAGATGPITALAFSSHGGLLAAGAEGLDGTVRLWNVADPAHPRQLGAPIVTSGQVAGDAFSPGGGLLAIALSSTLEHRRGPAGVEIWQVATRREVRVIPPAPDAPVESRGSSSVAFSPDGRYLADGGTDGSLRLFDLSKPGAPPRVLLPGGGSTPDAVSSVAFNPAGTILAAARGDDGRVGLWSVPGGRSLGELGVGTSAVSVAFSPDGTILAMLNAPSINGGGTGAPIYVQLFDVATQQPLGRSTPVFGSSASSLAFSPTGAAIATAGSQDTLINRLLWAGQTLGERQTRLCALVGRNLTAAEWDAYVPGQSYDKTCPQW